MKNARTRSNCGVSVSYRFRAAWLVLGSLIGLGAGCAGETNESPTTEGRVQLFHVDETQGEHRTGYALTTDSGQQLELEFAKDPGLSSGDRIRVSGVTVIKAAAERRVSDQSIQVTGYQRLTEETGTLNQAITNGDKISFRVAVVVLNMEGVTANSFTQAAAVNRLDSLRNYYREISYGIWNVDGDAIGPLTIPKPADCSLGTISQLGREAARKAGISVERYKHIGFALPSNSDSGLNCACGLAWVGSPPATPNPSIADTSLYTCTDANAFTHEMGHGFGLGHATTLNCGSLPYARAPHTSCSIDEYGNHFNTMGNGLGHMTAYQKASMKWLDRCNGQKVTRSGEYELTAIQSASDSLQTLQIATGDYKNGYPFYYYVEYRNPSLASFNTSIETQAGVQINVAQDSAQRGGDRRPMLLDLAQPMSGHQDARLPVGQTYTDPDGRVAVTVLSAMGDKAQVKVEFPNGGADTNLCLDGTIPGVSAAARAVLFQDCDFGGWKVELGEGDYDVQALSDLGVPNDDASSIQLAEDYEAVLYEHAGFQGNSVIVSGGSSCFVPLNFNDTLSSLRIRKRQVAKLYQDCSFGGYEVVLPLGDYTLADLQARGASDKDLSSLQIPAGLEVVLYEGDNFTGESLVLNENSECFVYSSFNDRASSARVRLAQ